MSLSRQPLIRPEFLPLSIARAIWKGKLIVVLIWVAISAGSYVVVSRLPSEYWAEAVVLVDSQKIPHDYVSSTVRTDVQDRLASIRRQVLSMERLKKLVVELDLYPARQGEVPDGVADQIGSQITVTPDRGYSGGLTAFRIGFTGPDPRTVANVANRVAAFFVEENLKDREVQAEGTAEFIDVQLEESKKRLDDLETKVTHYKMQHSAELPQQENALLGRMSRLQAEMQANSDGMNRARQSRIVLENSLDVAEANLAAVAKAWEAAKRAAAETPKPAATPRREAVVPPQVQGNPEIEKLQAQLDDLRLRYSDAHPDVRRVRSRLEKLVTLEAGRPEVALEPVPQPAKNNEVERPVPARPAPAREPAELLQARDRVQTVKAQMDALQREMDARAKDEQRMRQELSSAQARVDRLPVREQEMSELLRDYDIAKGSYQGLLGKKLSADMATDLERRQKSERFTIIDPARIPKAPSKPKRPMLFAIGCGMGLLLGCSAAFGNELRRNVLLGHWEFPPNTVVLGSLPRIVVETNSRAAPAPSMKGQEV